VRRETPQDQWAEIVRTAWLVASHRAPDDIELRIATGKPLTGDDLNYFVQVSSDAKILAQPVRELSEHQGAIPDTRYSDLVAPWP
jgi:hypothetical protein